MVNWVMGPRWAQLPIPISSLCSSDLFPKGARWFLSISMGLEGSGGLFLKGASWWVWVPRPQLCRELLTRPCCISGHLCPLAPDGEPSPGLAGSLCLLLALTRNLT